MFDRMTHSRIRALGSSPDVLGGMKDCAIFGAAGEVHVRGVSYSLTDGAWTLHCSCYAEGSGPSLVDAVEDWNEGLSRFNESRRQKKVEAAVESAGENVVRLREPGSW